MKNLIISLIALVGIVSCDQTDPGPSTVVEVPDVVNDPDLEAVSTSETIGELQLLITTARSTGINTYFDPGEITWDFRVSTLEVNNKNTDASKEDSFDTGTYQYSLEASDQAGVSNLVVDGEILGLFYHVNGADSLTVFPPATDGHILNFIKNP